MAKKVEPLEAWNKLQEINQKYCEKYDYRCHSPSYSLEEEAKWVMFGTDLMTELLAWIESRSGE